MYCFNPHFVFLYVNMLGLKGYECVSTIKNPSNAWALMATSSSVRGLKMECLQKEAFAYFEKPIDYDSLEVEIQKLVKQMPGSFP